MIDVSISGPTHPDLDNVRYSKSYSRSLRRAKPEGPYYQPLRPDAQNRVISLAARDIFDFGTGRQAPASKE